MGRYYLNPNPALPACCAGCGGRRTEEYPLIDTNLDIEFHGAVLFCQHCVEEMASLLGMASTKDTQEAISWILEDEAKIAFLREHALKLEALNVGLTTEYLSNYHQRNSSVPDPVGDSLDLGESPSMVGEEVSEPEKIAGENGDGLAEGTTGGIEEGDSETDESNSVERSSSVSSTSGRKQHIKLDL